MIALDRNSLAADEMVALPRVFLSPVWAKIVALMPDAQRARLVRVLADVRSASGWSSLWSQAVNAGRVLRSTFVSRGDGGGS